MCKLINIYICALRFLRNDHSREYVKRGFGCRLKFLRWRPFVRGLVGRKSHAVRPGFTINLIHYLHKLVVLIEIDLRKQVLLNCGARPDAREQHASLLVIHAGAIYVVHCHNGIFHNLDSAR